MSDHDPVTMRHIREIRAALTLLSGAHASVWMRISEFEARIRRLEEADETDGLADRIETIERARAGEITWPVDDWTGRPRDPEDPGAEVSP